MRRRRCSSQEPPAPLTRAQAGDVIIATGVGYHDFGASTPGGFVRRATNNPVTGGANPAFFAPDEALLRPARRLAPALKLTTTPGTRRTPAVREGIVVTGDAFIANPAQRDEIWRSLKASAVEMEGAAVAQVSSQMGVPFIVIRGITDNAVAVRSTRIERISRRPAATRRF